MKIYIDIQRPVKDALHQVLFTLLVPDSACDNPEEADLIIVETKEKLQELYNKEKYFAVFSIKEMTNLPANARRIPIMAFIPPITEYIHEIEQIVSARNKESTREEAVFSFETGIEYEPKERADDSIRVLVVDDNLQNLQLALELLGGKHYVTLASGYSEGLRLIRENIYDAVLSDCQMPPETKNTALSLEAITIGQTVHNGLFLIFHATKRGANVAIVTDANHHQDWVSALFDDGDLQRRHTVNGKRVLLINYMGKHWDQALKALMEQ